MGCPNLGLSVDYHFRCHCAFEELYLRNVYFLCKNVIEAGVKDQRQSRACLVAIRTALEVIIDVLQWNWNATMSLSTYIWSSVRSFNERSSVSASEEWSTLIKQPYLFEMFGSMFRKFREVDKEIARLSLRGLEQMASFLINDKGPSNTVAVLGVVSRPPTTYSEFLIKSVSQLLTDLGSNRNTTTLEVFQAAGVVSRMASNQHVRYLMSLTNWLQFLSAFVSFTEMISVKILSLVSNPRSMNDEELEDVETSQEMLAFSMSIHAWHIFAKYAVYRTATDTANRSDHPDPKGQAMNVLKESLGKVYSMYLRTRLQLASIEIRSGIHDKPKSVNLRLKEAKNAEDDDNVVEEEVSDQLFDAAICGRAHLKTAIPMIGQRLQACIKALNNISANDQKWTLCVEEIYWLLLMTGHLLSDSSDWELTSTIPRVISAYETESNGHVVQLIRTCFSLFDWEKRCFESNKKFMLSPLLSSTMLWFCDRIVRTYFFRVKRAGDGVEGPTPRSDNTADSFISCFQSLPLYNQFLELVMSNLERWSGNDEVLAATARLLRSCCSVNRLSYKLMGLSGYTKLLNGFAQWSLEQVTSPIHRKIISSIFIARISDNNNVCEEYYGKVLQSVMKMITRIADPNFPFHDSQSVLFCGALLEKLNGLIDGTNQHNVHMIRKFLFSCLPGFRKLMEVYKTDSTLYVPLVRLCTRFVGSQADNCSTWETSDLNTIFDMSMAIIKFCRGAQVLQHKKPAHWSKQMEKEQYQLIRRLILLLIALLKLVTNSGNRNENKGNV